MLDKLFITVSYKLVALCLLSIIPLAFFDVKSWVYFIPMSYVIWVFILMSCATIKRNFIDKK